MSSLRLAVCVIFSSLFFWGCSGPIQLQPLPIDHPANPEAPEAPVQGPPQALRDPGVNPSSSPPSERPMDHEHQTKAPTTEAEPPEGAVYSCPMHPEVKASAPGRCPKCGMALKQEESK